MFTEDIAVRLEVQALAEAGFHLDKAQLWAGTVEDGLQFVFGETDIYEMLFSPIAKTIAETSEVIGIATTGWAAPLDKDGNPPDSPPSLSPERRRVRLMVLASRESVMSVLRFEDDPFTPVTDPGQATGSLADAIQALYA